MVTTILQIEEWDLFPNYWARVMKQLLLSPFIRNLDDRIVYHNNSRIILLSYEPTFSFIKATYAGLSIAALVYIIWGLNFWVYFGIAFCGLDYFTTSHFTTWAFTKSTRKAGYKGEIKSLNNKEVFNILWDKRK